MVDETHKLIERLKKQKGTPVEMDTLFGVLFSPCSPLPPLVLYISTPCSAPSLLLFSVPSPCSIVPLLSSSQPSPPALLPPRTIRPPSPMAPGLVLTSSCPTIVTLLSPLPLAFHRCPPGVLPFPPFPHRISSFLHYHASSETTLPCSIITGLLSPLSLPLQSLLS